MQSLSNKFSDKVNGLQASAIREIFKLLSNPNIISLAGGAPAQQAFPAFDIAKISNEIFATKSSYVLQYGLTEGYPPLLAWIKKRLKKLNSFTADDGVIVTSGGQQGIDLTAKSLINAADNVVCEQPSFIGGLNAFRSNSANLIGVPLKDDGLDLCAFENIAKNTKIKLLYTIPTFQNPTGITMSGEKRSQLVVLAEKYDFLILEDDPYSELKFAGDKLPNIKSFDKNGRVVYCSSFSKIFSPGMRLGYICANKQLIEKVTICKQVSDVHTNMFAQVLLSEYLNSCSIDEHVEFLINNIYRKRCMTMLECIDKYFPKSVRRTDPKGGFFVFCTMPEEFDSKELLKKSLEQNVAFVPGASTMIDENKSYNTFRLSFANVSCDDITKAIKILGKILKEEIM